jgi:phosphatidylinositol glycan class V
MSSRRDLARLLCLFCAWKALLLAVVLAGPGDSDGGYDSSTQLHLGGAGSSGATHLAPLAPLAERLLRRLTRWDAVYFTQTAARGYVREQEWAFGWGFAAALRYASRGMCM